MAEKQSILGRIAQLTRANVNALLDRAEDPEKMLNQLVRDYTASIAEARDAVAQTIGNLRLAEKDHDADVAEAKDWGNKALAASRKADQLRSGGDTAGADKWDSLAKIALTKQITAENEAKAAEPMIASQRQVVEQLKTGLQQMEVKLGELRSKRDQLIARQKTAEAQVKVQGAIRSINVLDPTSELSRYEDQVRRVEAQAMGQMELAGSSLESQFAELEASSTVWPPSRPGPPSCPPAPPRRRRSRTGTTPSRRPSPPSSASRPPRRRTPPPTERSLLSTLLLGAERPRAAPARGPDGALAGGMACGAAGESSPAAPQAASPRCCRILTGRRARSAARALAAPRAAAGR